MTTKPETLAASFPYADLTTPAGREALKKMNHAARGPQGGWEAIQNRNNLLREVMRPAWEAEFRRVAFMATDSRALRESYGPTPTIGYGEDFVPETTESVTLDDVIADVVCRFDRPVNHHAGPEGGFGGEDTAVWLDGRLLAVVRPGAGGVPEVVCL